MQEQATESLDLYRVVMNHEEQYSLLPSYIDNPAGWHDAGFSGEREACLEYISKHWTDMRPLSLRRHMAAQGEPPARLAKATPAAAKTAKAAAKGTGKAIATAPASKKPSQPASKAATSKTASTRKPATKRG